MTNNAYSIKKLNNILSQILPTKIKSSDEITGSKNSKAFLLRLVDNSQTFLRINDHNAGFIKDHYAYINFSSPKLLIPKIIGTIFYDNSYYCLSEVMRGKLIDNFKDEIIYKLLPKVLDLHLELIKLQISVDKRGYGVWDMNGNAPHDTWREYLVSNENRDQDEEIYKRMLSLVKYCPETRNIIHGDFGLNNILSDGKTITGVIDWSDSKYGDFLYDSAWIRFWSSDTDYYSLFLKLYKLHGISINNFSQRLACYTCHLGLNILKFLKNSQFTEDYKWAQKRLQQLIY